MQRLSSDCPRFRIPRSEAILEPDEASAILRFKELGAPLVIRVMGSVSFSSVRTIVKLPKNPVLLSPGRRQKGRSGHGAD